MKISISTEMEFTKGKLVKGFIGSGFTGLAGFLLGLGVQAVAEAAGVGNVSTIPVKAILPIFTILSIVLGFGLGLREE